MNKLWRILRFEFLSITAKKSWLIPTLIFVVLAFLVAFAPQIGSLFGYDGFSQVPLDVIPNIGVTADGDVTTDEILPFVPGMPQAFASREAMEQALLQQSVDIGYIVHSVDSYSVIQRDTVVFSNGNQAFDDVIRRIREQRFLDGRVDYEAFRSQVDRPIENIPIILGTDGESNYGFTYGLIFVVYFLVIFYGTTVSTSVAREKSDRTMELLVTSANPTKLFFGKVFGAGMGGLLQFSLITAAVFIGFGLNHKAWGFNILRFFEIPSRVLVIFLAFTLVGYLLYLFIYAMLGSTVSKVEDISSATTPIMLLMVASFMVVNVSMRTPDSIVMKIASFIPFSSPIAMFARSSLGSTVTTGEILLSFAILVASALVIAFISSKLYRLRTLNYGNRLRLGEAIRLLRRDAN